MVTAKDNRPTPGIHKDIEESVYHSWSLCSKHALDVILDRSPAHLLYSRNNPKPATPTQLIGSALHCRVLEPNRFANAYPVASTCAGVKKGGVPCENPGKFALDGKWYCGMHKVDGALAVTTLNTETVDQVEQMKLAIYRHPYAAALLNQPGENELSVVWDEQVQLGFDPEEGLSPYNLRCKLRADAVRGDMVIDLKTCESAGVEKFTRAMADYGYYRQAAHYIDGITAAGRPIKYFAIVAVEKEPPYAVAVHEISASAIEIGREELTKLKLIYATCEASGNWYGYAEEIRQLDLPPWKFKQIVSSL